MRIATTAAGTKIPLTPGELRDRGCRDRFAAALLASESPKTPGFLALPAKVLDRYFPQRIGIVAVKALRLSDLASQFFAFV